MNQPLFFAPESWAKVAGYKLPANPQLWQSEIIRYLKSSHPYLPLEAAEVQFQRLDVSKGVGVGSVIIGGEMAIPIIITRPRPGADSELAPLDVFFHNDRYAYLDPEAVRQLTQTPQIGQPEDRDSRAFGGNPYIGDVTGDASPLEYSGQASPFAGPYDGTKSASDHSKKKYSPESRAAAQFGTVGAISAPLKMLHDRLEGTKLPKGQLAKRLASRTGGAAAVGAAAGWMSTKALRSMGLDKEKLTPQQQAEVKQIVKKTAAHVAENGLTAGLFKTAEVDENDIADFRRLVATIPNAFTAYGVDTIVNRAVSGPTAAMSPRLSRESFPNILQIFTGPNGGIWIKFSGSPEQRSNAEELKNLLGDRFQEAMARLKDGDVVMEHDGLIQATWSVDAQPAAASKPIMSDGLFALRGAGAEPLVGFVVQAVQYLSGEPHHQRMFVSPDGAWGMAGELFGSRIGEKNRLPAGQPTAGSLGTFVHYVHGTPVATVPLKMKSASTVVANGTKRTVYLVTEEMTGKQATLSPIAGVLGIERMSVIDPGLTAVASGDIYFMPADAQWVPLRKRVEAIGSIDLFDKLSSAKSHPVVALTYGSGLWSLDGEVHKLGFFGPQAISGAANFASKGVKQLGTAISKPGVMTRGLGMAYNKAGGGLKGAWEAGKTVAPGLAVAGTAGAGIYGGYKAVQASDMQSWEAREALVAMGMSPEDAQWAVKEAAAHEGMDRGVKLANLHESQARGHQLHFAVERRYDKATKKFAASLRPSVDLLKAAAESSNPETLDAVLSLEFITPQNMRYFTDHCDEFDETCSRLAALLIAVRLGLPHVSEQPVKDSLEGLAKTVSRLKILKSAMENQNAQATTETAAVTP
jgi:hypothetical protein